MKGIHMHASLLPIVSAALAAAVPAAPPAIAGDQDETVIILPHQSLVQTRVKAMVVDDDRHVVELRVDNSTVTVTVDGKEIAQDRLRAEGGRFIILDEDGNEMKSLNLFINPGGADFVFPTLGGDDGVAWPVAGPQPDVMIGVHLGDPGKALRTHLRLEPGVGTMISGLYKGLAADKAGLELYDIIVAVEGDVVDNPATIMEALSGLAAGDEVMLGVIQRGRRTQFDLTVEAFDASRMNPSNLIGGGTMARIEIPNFEFEIAPGMDFKWRQLLLDPESKEIFRWWSHDNEAGQGGDQKIDERLENLNDRMQELHDMIDQLIEQARQRER